MKKNFAIVISLFVYLSHGLMAAGAYSMAAVANQNTLPPGTVVIPSKGNPTPNFIPPTYPAQLPPSSIPNGMTLRIMSPTEQYPTGYWRIMKPQIQGGFQGIDPITLKPTTDPSSHVPLPPNGLYPSVFDLYFLK